ncbi:MAG: hypothetical protein IPL53_21230 [Ignavibacteria bacterium]|nr:hypothetical protein [Ignavibacteria bacterium]
MPDFTMAAISSRKRGPSGNFADAIAKSAIYDKIITNYKLQIVMKCSVKEVEMRI